MQEAFSTVAASGDDPQTGEPPVRAPRRKPRQRVLTSQLRLQASPAQREAWEHAAHTARLKLSVWCRRMLNAAVGLPLDAAPRAPALGVGASRSPSSPDAEVEVGADLDAQLRFQVSSETRSALESTARAHGTTLSRLMRSIIDAHLSGEPVEAPPRRRVGWQADPALLRQLAAIGNNANQIARRANVGGLTRVEWLVIMEGLADIQGELRRLEHPPSSPDRDDED